MKKGRSLTRRARRLFNLNNWLSRRRDAHLARERDWAANGLTNFMVEKMTNRQRRVWQATGRPDADHPLMANVLGPNLVEYRKQQFAETPAPTFRAFTGKRAIVFAGACHRAGERAALSAAA